MPTSGPTTSRRTAGLGLLAYGIATPAAFMAIGSPGGDYDDHTVATYMSGGHWVTAFVLAYLGAFASLGLLVFARRMRHEVGSAGDLLWGLLAAGTGVAVAGWFMVGGISVAMAEGGSALATLPHPVVYLISEIANLVAVCASAFLIGVAALVLGARSALPAPLRVFSSVAGVCGILGPVFFPLFLFWLWAIVAGIWAIASGSRAAIPAAREAQPV
jgi:hypothetical protein